MKKLIFRKILLDITFFFLLTAFSLTLIVWVIQAVNYLDFVSEDGHNLKVYFLYTFLNLPKMFSKLLPFIIFISTFYIITIYEKNNELIIFWTYGISKIYFINIIFKFSILFVFLQIFFSTFILPLTQSKAKSFLKSSNVNFFPQLLKEKKFIDTVNNLTFFIDSKDDNGELKNVFLKEKVSNTIYKIIYAKKGLLVDEDNKKSLVFKDGIFINFNSQKNTFFEFKDTSYNLSNFTSKSTTYPKIQERNTLRLLECLISYKIKKEKVSNPTVKCNEDSIGSVIEELARRIVMPFYIPITLILSSLLILKSSEDNSYNKFKIGLFFLIVMIIVLSEITTRYVGLSDIYSICFAVLPLILTTLTYFIIYVHIKKEVYKLNQ
ncbi:LptF/LptG family permease [Candidatus Pelagibacter sp.]|nr:LptF/LptG family permease [Candidatus Pelagibacter sp.]